MGVFYYASLVYFHRLHYYPDAIDKLSGEFETTQYTIVTLIWFLMFEFLILLQHAFVNSLLSVFPTLDCFSVEIVLNRYRSS